MWAQSARRTFNRAFGQGAHTNIPEAPWFTVESDDKERARLNCVRHVLVKIPYEALQPETVELTPRKPAGSHVRPPRPEQFYVPQCY